MGLHSRESQELPLFSPINLLLAGVAIGILILVMVLTGSRIFNPGQISSVSGAGLAVSQYQSHADFAERCELCHQPLQMKQSSLCMECHQDVDRQILQGSGVHGVMANVSECRACHPDHKGRDFSMTAFALQEFDHTATDFPLEERHSQVPCADCHTPDTKNISTACESCHAEPDVHAGMFPIGCEGCHTGKTWQEITWQGQPFDHGITGFSLGIHQSSYSGSPMACQDCHQTPVEDAPQFSCDSCHANHDRPFMDDHRRSFGSNCLECHDGADRMQNFDHSSVFTLAGQHLELVCADCHTGQTFNEPEIICATCHEEPEIHAGYFGLRCQDCHTDTGWQPARLVNHTFPLDHGGQGESSCVTCHTDAFTTYTCYTCHEHDEDEVIREHREVDISAVPLVKCTECHSDGLEHEEDDE